MFFPESWLCWPSRIARESESAVQNSGYDGSRQTGKHFNNGKGAVRIQVELFRISRSGVQCSGYTHPSI